MHQNRSIFRKNFRKRKKISPLFQDDFISSHQIFNVGRIEEPLIYVFVISIEEPLIYRKAGQIKKQDLRKKTGGNIEAAQIVGKLLAQRAKDLGIKKVVFDRGSYLFHGRVKALATSARAEGLIF